MPDYEALREEVLGAASRSKGKGLVVLVRHGMRAWMKVCVSVVESRHETQERVEENGFAESERRELVGILSSIVMAHCLIARKT